MMHRRVLALLFAATAVALAPAAARAACTGTVSAAPNPARVSQPVTVTTTAANCEPSSPLFSYVIEFGDGATATVSNTGGTVVHAYAAAGTYLIRFDQVISLPGLPPQTNVLATTLEFITAVSLAGTPNAVTVGEPVVFTATGDLPPALLAGATLAFGDGASTPIASFPVTAVHRYATPGTYTARVLTGANFTAASTQVVVLPPTRVPLGTISDSFAALSPIFSGGTTNIIVHYRITSPFAINPNGQTALQVLVDLDDARGHLVRRSDPFALFVSDFGPNTLQTAVIPYTVPVDGGGTYHLVVWIRTVQGGTVAVGPAVPFYIVGGADPAPTLKNQIKAAGALVAGGPLLTGGGGGTINVGMTTQLQWPTYSLAISGLYDPISHKSDPVFNLQSSTPGPVTAPDAQSTPPATGSAPAAPRLKYTDVFGRAQAALPGMLGGGETLHGLDFTYDYGDIAYHASAGYTQLKSTTTGARRGALFDLTRNWSQNNILRFTLTDNRDDMGSFISVGGSNPLDGHTGYLEWDRQFSPHFKAVLTGARSTSKNLITNESFNDGADKIDLIYNNATAAYDFEYHNMGDLFATGAGLGATADSVGASMAMQFGLSSITQLGVNLRREDKHSIFSRDGFAGSTLTISPPSGAGITFTLSTDRQRSPSDDITTNQVGFTVQRSYLTGATWNFTTNISNGVDEMNHDNDASTRTLQAGYSFRLGPHSFGFGVSGTSVSSSSPNTMSNETLNYGFSFGGLARGLGAQPGGLATRQFELQLASSHSNTVQPTDSTRDTALNARLMFHLSPQLAPGVTFVGNKHVDANNPKMSTTQSAAGFRLDLQI